MAEPHVQELRGNVRVFARVRPFLPGDNAEPWLNVAADNLSLGVVQDKGNGPESTHFFNYDHCFSPVQGQVSRHAEVSI